MCQHHAVSKTDNHSLSNHNKANVCDVDNVSKHLLVFYLTLNALTNT